MGAVLYNHDQWHPAKSYNNPKDLVLQMQKLSLTAIYMVERNSPF